jgi:hypothetical protein
MAQININTQSAQYQTRHTQFREIVQYWIPALRIYFKMDDAEREAWLDADPFMADVVRFVSEVYGKKDTIS